MTDLKVTEAITVQFPMVHHAAEIGWTPLPPQEAGEKRGGVDGMFFRAELETKLGQFNPWMSADAVRQVIERLDAVPPTIEGNREMLAWLRGERQMYDETENRHRRVQVVDFEMPAENLFHVTWEWRLQPPARKGNRADVMFVVNGVPVAIVEHKNPKDGNAIEHGVSQLRRYEEETPELLVAPQLFNVTHLLDYWYGVTWNISRRYMARWKQPPNETYKFAVQSFFEPTDFLRTLREWILFYVEDGETRKSVLRQHQRTAIDKIVARCQDQSKQRGLIWHTQGSGKTFTLLTAARLILENKEQFRNATVILVVDRIELEGQLKGWVERLLGEMQQQDIPHWRANSKLEIQELLETDKRGLIVSMIHKFEGIDKDANTRDNIFVFIDEAHRSVAKDLGTYLMAAVPKATIIGFTGTPIARTEQGEGTFKIFGPDDEQGYLDKYSIQESIEDETTLPLRYTMAPSEMAVPADRLNREFFELAAQEEITDVDELNRILDQAVGLRTFLSADDRIEKVAASVAEHFTENVEPLGYKAFLVAVSRDACAKYKRALDKHLEPEWSVPVYSENINDKIERPLVAELQLSPDQEADTRLMFKKADEDPRILIVTDKLLTGFDAPLLYCMYLDKPMRDHVLLQAIARVNRPYVDANGASKPIGLVVDYVGVLGALEKALRFDSTDVDGAIKDLDLLLTDLLDKLAEAEAEYLADEGSGGPDERLEEIVYGRFLDENPRQAFFDAYKEIQTLWEILSPSPELRDHIDTYKKLVELYAAVRNTYDDKFNYLVDLAKKTSRIVERSATQRGLLAETPSVTFDVRTIRALQDEPGSEKAKVFNLVRGLKGEMETTPDMAPVLQTLAERANRILEDLQARAISSVVAMLQIENMAKEKEEAFSAAQASGLSSRAFAVYWTLRGDETLRSFDISAQQLAREAETLLARFPNAAGNPHERRRLRASLYKPLIGVHIDERRRIVDHIIRILLDADTDDA
ncbi:MAG: HsdR family type I site-specific deoxyribonuclease [Caldilineaceae bacterium SB0664_bin_27]|uniref:Type I restriction enzyme endonuclease subunit n=1 Tax=Caldilineaceae bacterium SB0664_bin_27 TaxID=2605260 RepID=A0A6B0YU84_9CHLR|nr:HsdR family type I site-specific deoxyribonuclease [Caldilineaceae bacterium SB0664_bin_27]